MIDAPVCPRSPIVVGSPSDLDMSLRGDSMATMTSSLALHDCVCNDGSRLAACEPPLTSGIHRRALNMICPPFHLVHLVVLQCMRVPI